MAFPVDRGRRLRSTGLLREWVAETRLTLRDLVQPLFVREGSGAKQPIGSLPGQFQWSVDTVVEHAKALRGLGIRGVLLFGIPEEKDATGSSGQTPGGVVPLAIRAIKAAVPDLLVIGDVCLCEYTDHAHCGVLAPGKDGEATVDNDATLPLLAEQARIFADAGCDVVAPSAMADGQVAAIRAQLDGSGHASVPILAYAIKYASAFYGPFREAAENTPAFGDRRAYQMDPANWREARVEAALDEAEGADVLMVKPALPYLDVICRLREKTDRPVAAYHVSGEYAMAHAAGDKGWIDAEAALLESLIGIRRAGADTIMTYAAEGLARSGRLS